MEYSITYTPLVGSQTANLFRIPTSTTASVQVLASSNTNDVKTYTLTVNARFVG